VIVGYEQSAAVRGGIGSLLLAARCGRDWVYVGAAGTVQGKGCGVSVEEDARYAEDQDAGRSVEGQELCLRPADANSRNRIPGLG